MHMNIEQTNKLITSFLLVFQGAKGPWKGVFSAMIFGLESVLLAKVRELQQNLVARARIIQEDDRM